MPHVFGPVPSRRLGRSLGIDCIPYKTCNLNCVYCECGLTTNQTGEASLWYPVDEIIDELSHWLASHAAPDWITLAGSGEPTLYQGLGDLVQAIRRLTDIRLALITNGVLFQDKRVRESALPFDLVLPSLDAASDAAFVAINRPLEGVSLPAVIAGLESFRQEFSGSIWLEVFIFPGVNDGDAELAGLKSAIERIKPERIQLNSLDRPGTDADVRVASLSDLQRVSSIIGLPNLEIISRSATRAFGETPPEPEAEKRIMMTLLRRPSTTEDLVIASGLPQAQLLLLLADMKKRDQVANKIVHEDEFWVVTEHQR